MQGKAQLAGDSSDSVYAADILGQMLVPGLPRQKVVYEYWWRDAAVYTQ